MTAPAISTTTVEDIDLTPVCERTEHGRPVHQEPPPADYWCDLHGCVDLYWCSDCVTFMRGVRKAFWCAHCHGRFASFEAGVPRVVPLR